MLSKYYPGADIPSVFDIDYTKLYAKGYRGIIFDIDSTLVPHGADSTPAVDALFEEVHRAGLKTVLLTNNDEERVRRFIRHIDTLYICDAGKPDPSAWLRAVKMLGVEKEQAVYIGDQVFVDVIGANNAGIDNILVRYLLHEGEKKLGVKRRLEKPVLWLYRHSKYHNRIGEFSKKD